MNLGLGLRKQDDVEDEERGGQASAGGTWSPEQSGSGWNEVGSE